MAKMVGMGAKAKKMETKEDKALQKELGELKKEKALLLAEIAGLKKEKEGKG